MPFKDLSRRFLAEAEDKREGWVTPACSACYLPPEARLRDP